MNSAMNISRNSDVQSIGNYTMTGKVFGKGHFARVEEATHRIIGNKVAIKIIDLTSIKEEYARRNLHREPRVMARLRHPCIAALYETMMYGPRLYVVMEAAGGGDLCAHVLAARGPARGLPEARARTLASQLVSAVRHMHARGVVHRDLKMENIMLDSTKQFIKIVDFGLSNLWSTGGGLRTPCGSLEYAAPELFVDGRRYGPEVDLWSIGVIVYGMVTGGLPFTASNGGEGKSRTQLRAAIARGFGKMQRAALAFVSNECKTFIQHLLEPNVGLRMKIEEASRHRWLRRPGMRMRTHPLNNVDPKINKEIYRQLSELNGSNIADVMAAIKLDPFGTTGGMYNIKTHLLQMQTAPGADLLWSSLTQEPRPMTPPQYKAKYEMERPDTAPSRSKCTNADANLISRKTFAVSQAYSGIKSQPFNCINKQIVNGIQKTQITPKKETNGIVRTLTQALAQRKIQPIAPKVPAKVDATKTRTLQSPKFIDRSRSAYGIKKPVYQDGGDCLDPRLPSIDEHSTDLNKYRNVKAKPKSPCLRKTNLDPSQTPIRLNSCPPSCEMTRSEFYRKAGDGPPSWRASGVGSNAPRLFLQNKTPSIKRASLGNITSPHSSSNSHCKSERAMPVGWYSSRPAIPKETQHLQRFRRTAPLK